MDCGLHSLSWITSDPLIDEFEHSKDVCGLIFEFGAVHVNSFNFFHLLRLSFISNMKFPTAILLFELLRHSVEIFIFLKSRKMKQILETSPLLNTAIGSYLI